MKTNRRRFRWSSLFAFALVLALLCAGVSVGTSWILDRGDHWARHDEPSGHQWLHRELDLSVEEAAAIDAFEPAYRSRRAALQEQFQAQIAALREQILATEEFAPEMESSIHELHRIHAQLQELSIRHYYQMLQVLPPSKQLRLRELAGQALSVPESVSDGR